MSNSLYDVTVPPLLKTLHAIASVMKKAELYCQLNRIDSALMIAYRLAPDMLPFARQIQIMTNQAKGMAARLTGSEIPKYPIEGYPETTFEEMQARVAGTIEYITSFPRERFDGSASRTVSVRVDGKETSISSHQYLAESLYPNFYFHATTAYDILRHAGVQLGKRDFLGWK